MPVEGTDLPLWGLEIDPDRARDDFRAFNARDDGKVRTPQSLRLACHRCNCCSLLECLIHRNAMSPSWIYSAYKYLCAESIQGQHMALQILCASIH